MTTKSENNIKWLELLRYSISFGTHNTKTTLSAYFIDCADPCWSLSDVILSSNSSKNPSSTDSLSISTPLSSVGRNMWSWGRAGTGRVDATDRWLQLKRQGLPVTDKGSPWQGKLGYQITALSSLRVFVVRLELRSWRLVGLAFELGRIAWQKWIKPGSLPLGASWWLCCLCRWLTLDGGQTAQERGRDNLESGGTDACFWKTPWRWQWFPQKRTVSFWSRRDGSLTLQRQEEEKLPVEGLVRQEYSFQ